MAAARPVMAQDYSRAAPNLVEGAGVRTWITRGANFVVAVSEVVAGAVLERSHSFDEYIVLLPNAPALVAAGDESLEADRESLTIVPPGASRVQARADGLIVRVFSNKAEDLLALAQNADAYADGAPDVTPLIPWPDPTDGFRLRNYRVVDYPPSPGTNHRIFRSTNLMINLLEKRDEPRDTAKLSPHFHDDFEQASLSVTGRYLHHCRYPWTPNLAEWREDEALEVDSPSVTVIPPKVIHTTRNLTAPAWLIDIFAPPRMDFSKRPGAVQNADDYPMPPEPRPPGGAAA